jgi:hypothetical protein
MLTARTHEAECLATENKRLASDWKLREDGLTGSHEIRIEHLMSTLKQREQQNCDLHKQLHASNVAIESLKAELATTRQEAKVCAVVQSMSVCSILNQADIVHDGNHVSTHHKSAQFNQSMSLSEQYLEHVVVLATNQVCWIFLCEWDR